MLKLFKGIINLFNGPVNINLDVRERAENYAHILDTLIDDRDDDLAKILLPIKAFLLELALNKKV